MDRKQEQESRCVAGPCDICNGCLHPAGNFLYKESACVVKALAHAWCFHNHHNHKSLKLFVYVLSFKKKIVHEQPVSFSLGACDSSGYLMRVLACALTCLAVVAFRVTLFEVPHWRICTQIENTNNCLVMRHWLPNSPCMAVKHCFHSKIPIKTSSYFDCVGPNNHHALL